MNLLSKQDISLNSNFYADQFNSLPNTFYKQDEMLQRLDSRDCMLCVVSGGAIIYLHTQCVKAKVKTHENSLPLKNVVRPLNFLYLAFEQYFAQENSLTFNLQNGSI